MKLGLVIVSGPRYPRLGAQCISHNPSTASDSIFKRRTSVVSELVEKKNFFDRSLVACAKTILWIHKGIVISIVSAKGSNDSQGIRVEFELCVTGVLVHAAAFFGGQICSAFLACRFLILYIL